ncbi:MAG: hypothetical protein AB7O77_17275 [Phycisphaerales bacterium]
MSQHAKTTLGAVRRVHTRDWHCIVTPGDARTGVKDFSAILTAAVSVGHALGIAHRTVFCALYQALRAVAKSQYLQ